MTAPTYEAVAREIARIIAQTAPSESRMVFAHDHAHAAGRDAHYHYRDARKVGGNFFDRCELHLHFHAAEPSPRRGKPEARKRNARRGNAE